MSMLLKRLKLYNNLRLLSSSINKGVIKASNPNNNQNVDLLENNLKGSSSIDELFSLVNSHYTIMNAHHVMHALNTIFTLQKQERRFKSSPNKILLDPTFEKLCSKLTVFAGTIDYGDVLDALKVLTLLNVPSNSTIYQTLLQLLRHSINQFSLHQIIFLHFLLTKVEKTPLSEAFLLALPMAFELMVPLKLDRTNTKLLADCLQFTSRNNVSNQCVEIIALALLRLKLNPRISLSVIWSVCDLQPASYTEPLLKKLLKNIMFNLGEYNYDELESTLTKLTNRFSNRNPYYYNQEFYDFCANYIIDNDTGFEQGTHFLRKVLKTNYFNPNIFEYVLKSCRENSDLLKLGDPLHVYTLICTAALTDYESENVDYLKKILMGFNHKYFLKNFPERENLLRYATSLCILGNYSRVVLEKIFNPVYLDKIYQKRFVHDVENIILLSQLIKLYKPEFKDLLPDNEWLRTLRNNTFFGNEFPLEGVLHTVFGGKNFVRTNVTSKMHHMIDHVIVLRKGGFPVHVEQSSLDLEDIPIDSSNQMILILGLSNQRYSVRTKIMKASTMLTIKMLEDKGYAVVPIDLGVFKNCQDFEKIPYIMEQIKLKTNYMEEISSFS
ncbi:uncharacterized protein [Onthophagus taurus]|uniref:uncharacterized protein isoform X1 n=1 Tax=Onthophagus taurus TaxID=166361 RepID=UPI0039BEC93C